MLLLRNKDQC